MSDTPSSRERFKTMDAASYDDLAGTFERYTRRFTRPTAQLLLEHADVRPGQRVLDVGTGTGVVVVLAAGLVGEAGSVLGVDLSEGMLEEARRRVAASDGAARITLQREDAEALTLGDASFDRVVSLYTLMHLPHPDRGVAEMYRVLKPGGRVAIAIGTRPPLAPRHARYYLRRLPLAWNRRRGKWLVATDFLDHLVREHTVGSGEEEHSAFARDHPAARLPGLLHAAGFEGVRTHAHAAIGSLATPEEFWDLSATFSSLARKRLAEASPEAVTRVRQAFFDGSRQVLEGGGRLVYPTAAYIATATK